MGEVMWTLERCLPPSLAMELVRPFEPSSKYFAPMDYLLYLEEDVAYRADRVDSYLTLLWHPTDENRAIGIKLKGFRFIFNRAKDILRASKIELSDAEFWPLVTMLEVALTAGDGANLLAQATQERLRERYGMARALVGGVQFDAREFLQAA